MLHIAQKHKEEISKLSEIQTNPHKKQLCDILSQLSTNPENIELKVKFIIKALINSYAVEFEEEWKLFFLDKIDEIETLIIDIYRLKNQNIANMVCDIHIILHIVDQNTRELLIGILEQINEIQRSQIWKIDYQQLYITAKNIFQQVDKLWIIKDKTLLYIFILHNLKLKYTKPLDDEKVIIKYAKLIKLFENWDKEFTNFVDWENCKRMQ